MPSDRWTQLPDGPWVLPDEETGIYVRVVAKLERAGQPSSYAVSGPSYETTEHPSVDAAKEAAEEDRYQPFVPQVNPDWPPLPEIITAWPLKLYVKETTLPYWQGSPTEIQRLAKRAEARLRWYFQPFQDQPREAWYVRPGLLRQQESLDFRYSVVTQDWDNPYPTSDVLREEIEARRDRVTEITLTAAATDRSWAKVSLANPGSKDIFDASPLVLVGEPQFDMTGTVIMPPQQLVLTFQTGFPAVRLRTIARTAYECADLHKHMLDHVKAGARPRVWDRLKASRLGVLAGAVIGVAVGFIVGADAGIWAGVLSGYLLGSLGDWLVRWTFPALELIDAWERTRWQVVKATVLQGLALLLALIGVGLGVLALQPSTSTAGHTVTVTRPAARPSTATAAAQP